MGIKGLNDLLKKHAPDAFTKKHLREYAYKIFAVDVSLYFYKYKASFGESWLSAFVGFIGCLRKNDIHCIFVFDGKAPPEKEQERQSRRTSKEKNKEKMEKIQNDLENFYQTGDVSEFLQELFEKYNPTPPVSLLSAKRKTFKPEIIENYLEKIKNQIVTFRQDDLKVIQDFFKIMNVPSIQAEGEAETFCSYLAKWGLVDGVISEDSDVLAYGTPRLLTHVNTSDGTCLEVCYNEIINSLEIKEESFTDLCIACGCDYNSNIKGVGPMTAFKLIKEFEKFENLPEKYDTTPTKYERCRELFTVPEKQDVQIQFCGKPNFEELSKFLFSKNLRIPIENFSRNFEAQLQFID